jgi:hypothetical protein
MAPHIHAYRFGLTAMVGLSTKSTYDSHRKIAQMGAAHGGMEDTNGVPGTLRRRLTRRNTNGLMSSTASFDSFQEEGGDQQLNGYGRICATTFFLASYELNKLSNFCPLSTFDV